MKVILDTNVILSAIFWKGVPGKILDLWSENQFKLILSESIFVEYKRVASILEKKYRFSSAAKILDIIAVGSIFVDPKGIYS